MRGRGALAALALICVLPASSATAATAEVQIRDNSFDPRSVRVEPGDTVTWDGGGFRPHTVTSDTGLFDSGQMNSLDAFSFRFDKAGVYYYHCRLHGRPQRGMWGVVVVGDPPKDERDRLIVPDDYRTIQAAVDAAEPGAAIVVRPGRYEESVVVTTPRLTIRGKDRFRTVLAGEGSRAVGIHVSGASGTTIKDLTVRDFTDAGIRVDHSDGFAVRRVDSLFNDTFGIETIASHDGTIGDAFAWGSGEAGIAVGRCFACGVLVEDVRARMNLTGVETVNATGVTVRASRLRSNGIGLLARSDETLPAWPGRAMFAVNNVIAANNVETIPPAGYAATIGYPFGTGVWLAGVANSAIVNNEISGHERYGVLVTDDMQNVVEPVNNRTMRNEVRGTSDSLDLAWDGGGANDCFEGNRATTSGPVDIQTIFPCSARPFQGEDYPPVRSDVDGAIAAGPRTDTQEPPEPRRPPSSGH